ncbi:C-type lectin domain family 2 member D11 [Liparis tanakae]|uniref:C-type lectin domain family 2 member D11 n=1 Tax=Liparis tanakae TaxID=230148 RepID=A0A4Z2ETE2_9TELE|nr:C-type lectin domain family 2 member D11 [Liparis tanakae]
MYLQVYGIVAVDNVKRIMRLLLTLLLVPAVSEGARGLGNGIYEYTDTWITWTEAQTFCRREHTDLVTVNTAEENLKLTNKKGWIGLYREGSDWKWSRGGEKASFFNWETGK